MTFLKILPNIVDATTNSATTTAVTIRACHESSVTDSEFSVDIDTSHDDAQRVLACSPSTSSPSVQSLQAKLLKARKRNELLEEIERGVDSNGYPLCEFRKGFFDHLKPRGMITSTLRVSLQQAMTILVNFMAEQLELDLKRNQRVNKGEITQLDADLEAEEWEKVEWDKRWKTFPHKFVVALTKYHAVVLILRSYELVASKIVSVHKLHKLTMDPFAVSKRMARNIDQKSQGRESVRDHKISTSFSMTGSTIWANLLPFLSDYTLHQALLCFGYFKYYNYQRQRRLLTSVDQDDDDAEVDGHSKVLNVTLTEDDKDLARDLASKSYRLAANRGLGLMCSSIGAGIGSVVWPGWGTIVISAIGDGAAGMILDDGYHKARQTLEERQTKDQARDDSISRQVQ